MTRARAGAWPVAGIALAVALGILGAAAPASAQDEPSSEPARSIRQVLEDQAAAWNRGDLDAFMEGYWRSEDLVFTSGGNVQRGWQTTLDRYPALEGFVIDNHEYDVPEVLAVPVAAGNPAYLAWISAEVATDAS